VSSAGDFALLLWRGCSHATVEFGLLCPVGARVHFRAVGLGRARLLPEHTAKRVLLSEAVCKFVVQQSNG